MLIATGSRAIMGKAGARPPVDDPAAGALPEGVTAIGQMDHKLRTSEGRAG